MITLFRKNTPAPLRALKDIEAANEADRAWAKSIGGRVEELQRAVSAARDRLRAEGTDQAVTDYVGAVLRHKHEAPVLEQATQLAFQAAHDRIIARSVSPAREALAEIAAALESKISAVVDGERRLAADLELPAVGDSPTVGGLRSRLGSVRAAQQRLDEERPGETESGHAQRILGVIREALSFCE